MKSEPPPESPPAPALPPADPDCVEQTLAWIIEGAKDEDVRRSIAHHWPDQSVEAVLLAITDRLMQVNQVPPELHRAMCIEATWHLYSKMLATNDLVSGLRAIRQIWEITRCS